MEVHPHTPLSLLVFPRLLRQRRRLENFPITQPQDSLPEGHDKGCLQVFAGSPTPLAESSSSSRPPAGWVRRDKTELLLIRPVASLPSLSLASPLTISSVLTALRLAALKLPLPCTAHNTHMGTRTHVPAQSSKPTTYRCAHATHTQHLQACTHVPTTDRCVHRHTHAHTYHTHRDTHTYTHGFFLNLQTLQTHFFPEPLFFQQIPILKSFYSKWDKMHY